MFRRSRFSARPNVGTVGRTAATPREAPSVNQDPSETPRDVGEGSSGPTVTDDKSVVTSEKNTASGDGNDQNGEGGNSSTALQRRKRFSVKPKVAPGRPTPLARTAKSPVKPDSEIGLEASDSEIKKPRTSSQPGSTAASPGLRSPRRRRPSEDVKQAKVQPKPMHIPLESKAPSAVPPAENSLKPADSGKPLESTSGSQVKDAPPRVPLLIPDKEAIELSEKAKTLVSSKRKLSLSPSALSLSRLLNDPSDLQRLAKAQKLKELLREERHKEKKRKAKMRLKEFTLDPTKMTMRDLLHYVPLSNPMSSSLENSTQEEETVIPASPGSMSPERAQQPEVIPKIMSPREEQDEEANEEEEEGLMVPQVKVAEDGSLIIDEESLTVEVQRAKGPNPAHDRNPIFERGSTTTYSSFRKGTCSKPWCSEETDMFFLAISMVGTDFSMICQLFPHRARAEIKNKFKKEERQNAWRIDKAFRERRKLDIEYFSKLLEKIMEVQKNRKKLKSLAEKPPKKRKAKGRKSARKLSDVEEDDEEDENLPDLDDEEGGGKENELLCNEGEAAAAKPKRQRKRKTGEDASKKEQSKKRSKKGEKSSEQDEPCTPQDTEAALPEDPKNSDISVNTENADNMDTAVKPAKLSRGRAPKPLLPLGRKLGKKVPLPSTKAKESGDGSMTDATSKQVNEDASPSKISANEENSSEDDEAPVAPPNPTRYGRVPKPAHSSPAQHTPSAAKPKPKCTPKRGRSSVSQSDQESKKPRLVTLRATQLDDSDEENGQQWEQEEGEEEQNPACSPSKDSTAPAFVPASLRSPQAKISMVEETMEELDILANIPDVLGISQVALCPDASCEQAHNETCDHQLDLLVDVIDFLSSEHTEVTEDESYNEAAQTLLTIGNLYSQDQAGTQSHIPGTTSNNKASATSCIATGEQQADNPDDDQTGNEQRTTSDTNPIPQFQSSTEILKETLPQTVLDLELCQPPRTDRQFEPSFDQANQERGSISSQAGMTESESSSAAPDKSITESQVEEGLNTDSVRGPKDGHQSAAFIGSSEEDLPVCQEARSEVASSLQPRRSRSQKVKPKLPLTSCRAARSKPQVTKTPIPKPVAEVEPEPSCAFPPENLTENTGLVADLEPSLYLGTTEEQSVAEEKNIDNATFSQVDSGAATSGGNSSENKNVSQFRNEQARTFSVSASKSTNEKLMSDATDSGSNVRSSEMSHTETVEKGLNTDSVPGQEDGDRSVVCPTEDLPVSQEAQSKVASPLQPRRSRMQKVKPNLPLTCRAARSKPQVTKASKGKLTESTDPVSDLSESQDLSSSLTPTDDATLGQREAGGSSVDNIQPRSEETGSVSESTTPTSLVGELPVSQKAERPESSKDIMAEVKDQSACTAEVSSLSSGIAVSVPLLESSTNNCTEEQKTDVGFGLDSSSESSEPSVAHRGRRSVKVKPKPNLTSSIKASQSKLPPKGTSNAPDQQHVNPPLSVTRESEHTSSAHSEPEPAEKDSKNPMLVHSSINSQPLDSVKSASAEMETSLGCTGDKDASFMLASTLPEKASGETSAGDKMSSNTEVEVRGGCKADVSPGATEFKTQPPGDSLAFSSVQIVEEGCTKEINSASTTKAELMPDKEESRRQSFPQSDKSQDAAQQTSETTEVSQTSDEKSQSALSADESQLESSGSSKARPPHRGRLIKPKPNLARSSQLPRVQQVQNKTQARADTSTYSKDVDASVSHKAVSERRPEKKPVEGAAEQDGSPDHSPHSGAAVVQLGQLVTPSHDAESSLGCLTPVPPAQSVPTSSAEGTQSNPCLPLFSDMLLEQVPSDPDEPFFILSLTEIPVCSSGEVVDSAAEPLSYLPVTDASIAQQSGLPGDHVGAAAGDSSASGVPVLASTVESDEMSSINVNDSGPVRAAREKDLIVENPVNDRERPTVESPKTVESNNDAETTPTKPKPRGTGRKAKIQVEPTKARTKQGDKALAPNSIQNVEPDACDATAKAGDEVVAEPQTESVDQMEAAACAQGISSGAPTGSMTTRARSRTRKPKDSTSSVPAPAKAVSSSSKVKAPRGAGQRSSITPRNVAPAQRPEGGPSSTQTQRKRSRTTATGSSRSAEVSASQESDCVQGSLTEEEPTSVSQYFLSDIFTDVAEV